MSDPHLSHITATGEAQMVDVSAKAITAREAVAEAYVVMDAATLDAILQGGLPKGDVIATARLAGIMAAKRTSDLIPLCHPLALSSVTVEISADRELPGLRIEAAVRIADRTGVEMEALTAVTVAGLTIYDMAKAIDRTMRLEGVRVIRKSGGASGDWQATAR